MRNKYQKRFWIVTALWGLFMILSFFIDNIFLDALFVMSAIAMVVMMILENRTQDRQWEDWLKRD